MTLDSDSGYEYAPTTKPVLSEFDVDPWRYQCPNEDCASHSIIVRPKNGWSSMHLEARENAPRYQQRNDVYVHDFRCTRCATVFDRPYDKKRDERRLIRNEINR